MAAADMGDGGETQQSDAFIGDSPQLEQLLTALSGGVTNIRANDALDMINFWHDELIKSEAPTVATIGQDLGALRDALVNSDTLPVTLGDILLSLADGVAALGTNNEDALLNERLGNLSTLLHEAGYSLVSEDAGLDGVTDSDAGLAPNVGGAPNLGSDAITGNPTTTRGTAEPFANQ